ncbi:MAG: hypothetical protein CSA95_07915 [Bacteroidetes bacterium]|nr:MAG: hypothetical protein CSA95_07915 [Bacteroidota bacterium]
MSRNYYCLIAGLPEIQPDQNKVGFSLVEFKKELEEQLTAEDFELVKQLFAPYDNKNLLNLLQKRAFEENIPANYTQQELSEELREPGLLNNYLSEFIRRVQQDEALADQPVKMENLLTQVYYEEVMKGKNPFLSQWFEFDLTLRNILTALSCKKHGLPVEEQLIGNTEINKTMARSSSKDLGIAVEIPEIERIVQIFETQELMQREKSYDLLRWEWLEKNTTFNYFSIEVILSYVIRLMIVDRWIKLDHQTGTAMFKRLLNDIENSYQFPKEFNI